MNAHSKVSLVTHRTRYAAGSSPSHGSAPTHTHDWVALPVVNGWEPLRFHCRSCGCWGHRRWTRRGYRRQAVVEDDAAASAASDSGLTVVFVGNAAPAMQSDAAELEDEDAAEIGARRRWKRYS